MSTVNIDHVFTVLIRLNFWPFYWPEQALVKTTYFTTFIVPCII